MGKKICVPFCEIRRKAISLGMFERQFAEYLEAV